MVFSDCVQRTFRYIPYNKNITEKCAKSIDYKKSVSFSYASLGFFVPIIVKQIINLVEFCTVGTRR